MLQRRSRKQRTPALDEYLTIRRAAELLGVTPETLRNWDRANKFRPVRHPINGYRLYLRAELEALLAAVARRGRRGSDGGRNQASR